MSIIILKAIPVNRWAYQCIYLNICIIPLIVYICVLDMFVCVCKIWILSLIYLLSRVKWVKCALRILFDVMTNVRLVIIFWFDIRYLKQHVDKKISTWWQRLEKKHSKTVYQDISIQQLVFLLFLKCLASWLNIRHIFITTLDKFLKDSSRPWSLTTEANNFLQYFFYVLKLY